MARLFWISLDQPGRLAIAARPRAGDWLETEVASWREAGVKTVVSLLEPAEIRDLELQAEEGLCRDHDINFVSFPVADRGVPENRREAMAVAGRLASEVQRGSAVLVHCRAGIGRSASLAALVMAVCGVPGDLPLSFSSTGS